MYRFPKLPLVAALLALSLFVGDAFAARGRVKVQNVNGKKTVVTDDGQLIRAAPYFFDAFSVFDILNDEAGQRAYFDTVVKDYKLNCVRLSPWMGTIGSDGLLQNDFGRPNDVYGHKANFLRLMDRVVDWAEQEDIYVVINYHSQYGTSVVPARVKAFWDVVAPRYKNRTHVVYEILNEPDVKTAKQHMNALYKHVRAMAPNTHIICWSLAEPNQKERTSPQEDGLGSDIYGTEFDLADLNAATDIRNDAKGANAKASFGFHSYPWNREPGNNWSGARSWNVAQGYQDDGWPVICTEFHSIFGADHFPLDYGYLTEQIKIGEQKGISWMQWAPRFNKIELPQSARRKNSSGQLVTYDETRNAYVNFTNTYKTRLTDIGVGAWWNGSSTPNPTDPTDDDDALAGNARFKINTRNAYFCSEYNTNATIRVNVHSIDNGWSTGKWTIEKVAGQDGIYRIRNQFSGKYLVPTGDGNNKNIVTKDLRADQWSQMWVFKKVSGTSNQYRIQNRWNKEYLTARPPSSSNIRLRQWGLQTGWTDQKIEVRPF